MNPSLQADILHRLAEFNFKKQQGGYLREGICPQCQKRELYINAESPWVVRCGRLNNCGYAEHVKQLYPDLFNDWSKRYAELLPSNPNAIADAYLQQGRGFDLSLIKGTYTQESYFDHQLNIGSATVRFQIGNGYWERLIDRPERFGTNKARFSRNSDYRGKWWVLPSSVPKLSTASEIWITEGIFNSIALEHHGIPAVATLSSNNYPDEALGQLYETRGTRCRLVWAFDSDLAGRTALRKYIERARLDGWPCEAAQIPCKGNTKIDWNDMHQSGKFSDADIKTYRYHGALLIARTASEKALLIYNQENKLEFDFEFRNRLYWFDLSLAEYNKQMELFDKESDATLTEQGKREKALYASSNIREIANCKPTALYYQKNEFTDEAWYYFRVEFPHHGDPVKNTFTSGQIASSVEFKKRLLSIAPGGSFSGTTAMLDRIMERDLYNIKRVETIDYIGYSKEFGCYIWDTLAMHKGRLVELNKEDFFDLGRTSIKSLSRSINLCINKNRDQYTTEWVTHLWHAFGVKGMIALAYWLGSLFVEQIRAAQGNFPFLEIVGCAGAGKTTLIEFLWKLVGRSSYEGFDPSKATPSARARNLVQVSCLPVVFIESDRQGVANDKSHIKMFDWDEMKTAYNGRCPRSLGMKTSGNETYEPPFRGALVIAQNTPVTSSEAIISRTLHLYFDVATQSAKSGEAADALKCIPIENVSGFILEATRREKEILDIVKERTPVYVREFMLRKEIKMKRLTETHAQLLALTDALALVVDLTQEQRKAMREHVNSMACERQRVIDDDHPLVQEFWEAFDYLDGDEQHRLNHSRDPQLIAVNLNHFIQVATEHRQQVPVMSDLKKVLKTSRRRKFIDIKAVNSQLRANENQQLGQSSTVKCWVFQKVS